MNAPRTELDALATVAADLQREGWQVSLSPNVETLPPQIRDYEPDLVARKGDQHLVVEVKGKAALRRNPALVDWIDRVSARVRSIPGWSFRLVWLGDDLQLPASADVAARRAREAAAVAPSSAEAGLLLAWSAVETALDAALTGADREGQANRPQARAGRRLLELAFEMGLLDVESMEFLTTVARLRSAVAHGGERPEVDSELVSRLATWVLTFLQQDNGIPVPNETIG